MREIKFSYIQKDSAGKFNEVIYTLDDLETGKIDRLILAQKESYGIVARRQAIGKKDKNGKEIYEDDIISFLNVLSGKSEKLPVVFDRCNFVAAHKNKQYWIGSSHIKDIEIIGNIHEHPELLKGESQWK